MLENQRVVIFLITESVLNCTLGWLSSFSFPGTTSVKTHDYQPLGDLRRLGIFNRQRLVLRE
jgi:hypothetical protein